MTSSAEESDLTPVRAARERVSRALLTLQEAAMSQAGGDRLQGVVEMVAEASGQLFRAHRAPLSPQATSPDLSKTRELLAAVLQSIQRLEDREEAVQGPLEHLSQALELLEGVTSDRPPATNSTSNEGAVETSEAVPRSRKGLVLVVDDASAPGDEDRQPASESMADSDRRATKRVVLQVELGFQSESNFYTGLTLDLSTGGLFVATYEVLPVGTLVTLDFALPESHCVKVEGEVRWLRDSLTNDLTPGMGISFSSLQQEDLEVIREFCKSRGPLYYDVE